VAYEPVWAISTETGGVSDTPEDAVASIAFLRSYLLQFGYYLPTRFLYGGSVTSVNAASFLQQSDIDGVLVGGASLQPEEIKKIWRITQQTENTENK
jgi:triosephosphate isomerase